MLSQIQRSNKFYAQILASATIWIDESIRSP